MKRLLLNNSKVRLRRKKRIVSILLSHFTQTQIDIIGRFSLVIFIPPTPRHAVVKLFMPGIVCPWSDVIVYRIDNLYQPGSDTKVAPSCHGAFYPVPKTPDK